ncbi:MAG: glycosyltransferase family 4 protein [Bacteroidales bacterium]|nr:glycosyltransferase family 4 protein [Bacteroidales bacterium]
MKIAYIGTYPPRECGIGTFTRNLFNSMLENHGHNMPESSGFVVAMNDSGLEYEYPAEVKLTIRQEYQEDYINAAKFINQSDADICILEHEFGIYGGQSGVYILPMLHRLEIPLIVTLHTILKNPSYNEKAVLSEICKMAHTLVVMTNKAIKFLVERYNVPGEKIVLIEHGVPDIYFSQEESRKEFKLENKKVLLTFGFIGRNKGIETVIKALPDVVKKYPELIYIILGKTHPNVLRHSGEEYRVFLSQLVKSLNLDKHVIFLNEFLSEQDLFKYLYACDIYITPYLNESQITSGTLSYAVGVGSAVISTPYWHAEELLSEGRGLFFNFHDSKQLTSLLIRLIKHPEELNELKEKAAAHGRKITWPKSGSNYLELASRVMAENRIPAEKEGPAFDLTILPEFSLKHINRLTDDTGILQHAKFGIPNLEEGYCLDDNARALLMVLMVYHQTRDSRALELSSIYLSYIQYMQNPDGTFRNFISYNRNFLDELGSEDSFGRTIWALGYLLDNAPTDAFFQAGRLMFFNASPNFEKLQSIRSIANTMIGVCYYLKSNYGDYSMTERLRKMANRLVKNYEENSSENWKWFESLLAYDNGILPLALLQSAEILHDERISRVGIDTMNFLTMHTLKENYLSVIGNEKWYKENGKRSVFAQQPIDAMAMVLMYHQAYRLTGDKEFLAKLYTSFLWFLGENDLRMSLFDFETKGCCDGFEKYGVNRNQGAESSLAYLISHLTVQQAYEELHVND